MSGFKRLSVSGGEMALRDSPAGGERPLAKLGEAAQRREYGENRRHITAVTGAPVTAMSHPLNSYGPETLEILSELGIACGFRSDMRPTEALEIDRLPQLQIPRADSTDLLRAVKDAA